MTQQSSQGSAILPEPFLQAVVAQVDDPTVRAIFLHGSYARGDAVPPYSDVDVVRLLYETPEPSSVKRFVWFNGLLLNLSSRPLSVYQEWFSRPETAIVRVPSIQEARILLDKDGAFRAFQQEAQTFRWDPLQAQANTYAGQKMVELTEIILRILKVLRFPHDILLAKMLIDLQADITEAVAVQHGLLLIGQTYYDRVEQELGYDSAWVRYHRCVAGLAAEGASPPSLEARGRAALRLYQETVAHLHSAFSASQRATIHPLIALINDALPDEERL